MALMKEFEHLKIKLEDIKKSTNNFSHDNLIGQGGFGQVYTGEIAHSKGHTIVAFKRLNRNHDFGQGDPEFWREIMTLSIYRHENIVSLLGYCDDSQECILVYEYASRKSLDQYLHRDDLTWVQHLKICIGAARGLEHLHNPRDTQLRLLHRDIKSANILLDENWNAKISDFGLSKFGPANKQFTYLISHTVGTPGYCDPIYLESSFLTKESNVYSFGVVLFEVLCGRLCIRHKNDTPLIILVRKYKEKDKISELIYGEIENEINPNALKVFEKIAYQCLERERKERPSMLQVVEALENALKIQESINPDAPGYPSDDVIHERTRGIYMSSRMPWTEEEHRVFLEELKKVREDYWRGISQNFEKTLMSTQVEEQAQKYINPDGPGYDLDDVVHERKQVGLGNVRKDYWGEISQNFEKTRTSTQEYINPDGPGYDSDDVVHERKQGIYMSSKVPWTEKEHRLFLVGLEKIGKDWRGISRKFVKTRTSTQVASHAQEYFHKSEIVFYF